MDPEPTPDSWGGLNPALTAWRTAINNAFPGRSTTSDGGYADSNHGSNSQHQPDSDGTVDAFDMDVNLLASATADGSADEREIIEALKLDFERDGRAHLWIHDRQIAQHDEGWQELYYGGSNPHDQHVHWECRQDREDDGKIWNLPNVEALMQATVTGFNDDAKAQLETEATRGVWSYNEGGVPPVPGIDDPNMLNAFSYMYAMVKEIHASVSVLETRLEDLQRAR